MVIRLKSNNEKIKKELIKVDETCNVSHKKESILKKSLLRLGVIFNPLTPPT